MKKRILGIFCAIAVLIAVCPNMQNASAASIRLNKTKLNMNESTYSFLKVKGTKKKAKWTSSNKTVAIVTNKGKVIACKQGKTTITAKVAKKKLKCMVIVKKAIDEYAHIQTERFDIVASVIMNTGKQVTNTDGEIVYYTATGVELTNFYDDEDNLIDDYYFTEFDYYPEHEYIDIIHEDDYSSDQFDHDRDEIIFKALRLYRDDAYTCDLWRYSYWPDESGMVTTYSSLDKVYRNQIYHENSLDWDVEGEIKGSESWKFGNNASNSSLNVLYRDADRFLYRLIGYHLTDLGFNY